MHANDSQRSRVREQLKLALEYLFVFSFPRGLWIVAWIVVAKALRRPHVCLPVPGTRRTVRLRTASSDIATYNQIFIRREYDFSHFPQAARLASGRDGTHGARPRLTVIDCGANVGCSVIWFATQFPGAEIIAIEPDLANFELLRHNVAEIANVRVIRAALWRFIGQRRATADAVALPNIDQAAGGPPAGTAVSQLLLADSRLFAVSTRIVGLGSEWFIRHAS